MLTRRATLAGIAALGFPSAADAQGFPSRSITIMVPYPPGGPVDALARLIAQEAAGDLNQPIVVENRPGGSGIIGTQAVARAEPDGYVLVLGTNQTHATNQSLIKNCPYDAVKDFAPVAGIAAMPHVLVVRKSLVLRSVGDVVAMAKAKPGSLTFGSTGNGSGAHLAGELFKTKAGIDMLHVPFKGLSPMLTELLADRIDLSIAPLPGLIGQQIESGAVRALGLARAGRVPQLMSVPTFAESGVPGSKRMPGLLCSHRRARRRRSSNGSTSPSPRRCRRVRCARQWPNKAFPRRSRHRRRSPPCSQAKWRNGPR
jgi:tripartite-type tricarboxylate transporter receptor subunit TctC